MLRKRYNIIFGITACLVLVLTALTGCFPIENNRGALNLWDVGPLTLDPAISSEMSSHIYVMHIFSGLVKFDNDLKPVPDIAESWELSPDGKTYTFKLRKDVQFHNGRQLTAADIKYSWERACNPETGSQTASLYLGDITGVEYVLSGKAKGISGVQVIDDYTLQVTIHAPIAYFLSKLAYPTAFAVDKKNVESGANWWHKPNGTGPYVMSKWDEGTLINLNPNPQFYGHKASVRVSFHILSGYPMSLYETNKIDVCEITSDYIDRAADKSGPFSSELKVYPEFSLQYIGFNTGKPPFNDPLVRQAFCLAVDKERIFKIIQKDMVTPAYGIIPPGMPGHNPDLQGLEYNPEKARNLIAKSSYGSPDKLPPITITVPSAGGIYVDDSLGAIIQDWKNNLGVEVTVRLLESSAFHYNLMQEADEMYSLGWIADYPDPQNFLYTLFYTGTEYNDSHYSNPELDQLLDKAAVEQDYDSRLKLYQHCEQIVVNDAPVLPLSFGRSYFLINPRVHDFEIDPLGVPRLNLVTLDK